MESKHRAVNDYDLLNYLQENNALLKTILSIQENESDDPNKAQIKNVEIFREHLKNTKFVFSENTKIKK